MRKDWIETTNTVWPCYEEIMYGTNKEVFKYAD